jgi:hypothetical protein
MKRATVSRQQHSVELEKKQSANFLARYRKYFRHTATNMYFRVRKIRGENDKKKRNNSLKRTHV